MLRKVCAWPPRAARLGLYVALLALLLGGCEGGSGGGVDATSATGCDPADPGTADQCGTVLISITDADGDFVAYAVDVLSVALHGAAGTAIEALPATTRIDFASLADIEELLGAATVPPGTYVGGTIRLDYSNAEAYVESGGEIVPAEIVGADGTPLGLVEVDFRLPSSEPLAVVRASVAALTVDFDLAASHAVDLDASPVRATARPYVVAEVAPVDEKALRIRGALARVDAAGSSYGVRVRPWHRRTGDHGLVTVHTTGDTHFDIEGELHIGQPGLAALAQLDPGTLTVAFGTLDLATRKFTAERVHAGSGEDGRVTAAVYGNVTARSGDRLIVSGALAVGPNHPQRFHRRVAVEVGPQTRVYKMIRPLELLDAGAISVGQRIVAYGELLLPAPDAGPGSVPVLDATDARVRMVATRLRGTVTAVQPDQINLRLRAIDRLGVALFDFSGTGLTPALDADPDDYAVATGTLPLAALAVDEPAHVLGFVVPFGAAPPDFEGRTLIGHQNLRAVLGLAWGVTGTSAPFVAMGPDGLVPNLADPDIGQRHHLLIGARLIDLHELPGAPLIAPRDGRALYGIWESGRVELYRDFASFVDALTRHLGQGDKLQALAADGEYNAGLNTLTAAKISVHVTRLQ